MGHRILYISHLYQHKKDTSDGCFITQQISLLSKTNQTLVISPVPLLPHKSDILSPNTFIERVSGIPSFYRHNNTSVYAPKFFRLPKKPFFNTEGKFFVRAVNKRLDKILEFNPEILHSYWLYPDSWAASQISRKLKIPHVVSIPGSDIYLIDHRRISSAVKEVLQKVSAVIIQNSREEKKLNALPIDSQKIHMISNGVDVSRFFKLSNCSDFQDVIDNNCVEEENFKILYVGHFYEVKRVDVLIKAFEIFHRKHPKSSLYIIGKGRLKSKLNSLAASLLPSNSYKFIHEVPQTHLRGWYNAVSTLVLPSVSEGNPNVVMEALACGTPVIGSDIPGTADLIENGSGLTFEPGSPDDLADKLIIAARTNWDREEISKRARIRLNKEDRIKQINALYAGLVH